MEGRWCVPLDCQCGSTAYINGSGLLLVALSLPFNTIVSVKPCCSDNHCVDNGAQRRLPGKNLKLTISELGSLLKVFQWYRKGWSIEFIRLQ